MQDSYRHKGLRKNLVEEIRLKGISDQRVLDAINRVPRHFFMDSGFINFAYKDSAFPIGAGQTISQPFTVAFQTQLLSIQPHEKVLEIGTGSGYQTAVLIEMGANVFTIERQKELYLKAKTLLEIMGYRPHLFYGDGYLGMPSYGPYNKIIITAGTPEIPEKLIEQLDIGGKLIAPVGNNTNQVMTLVEKISATENKITKHGNFIFVPLLKGVKQ
jgi:protein-L-isoaspartate(D-aspartate) O-methyltransferase